jgi:uncharacterized protein YraI
MKKLIAIVGTISITLSSSASMAGVSVGPGNLGNVSKATICTRDGDNYNLRTRPNPNSRSRNLVASGRQVILLDDVKNIAGFTWRRVNFNGVFGWVRGDYLCN